MLKFGFVILMISSSGYCANINVTTTTEIPTTTTTETVITQSTSTATQSTTIATQQNNITDEFILPEGIKTCSKNDPQLNECFKETFQEQIKLLKSGSKALNIPPLDPWIIPRNRIDYASFGLQMSFILSNLKFSGLSDMIIKDVRSKIDNNGIALNMKTFFPAILMQGNFRANVKFNDLKMKPKGTFNMTMGNITDHPSMYGNFDKINGKRHLRLKGFIIDPTINNFKFHAEGLFSNPSLDNIFVTFVNQYWRELYKFIIAETKITWQPILVESTNQFLSHVPVDVLIKDLN